jgi:tRNA 2-thiouridine synthesizing protein B
MLHLVNKSPYESNALLSCLQHALPDSAVLLYENGVFAAVAGNPCSEQLSFALTNKTIYALLADVEARGVTDRIQDGIKLINYDDFVDLVIEQIVIQAWN